MDSQFYKVPEMARMLGCSEGAVRQRLYRRQIPTTRFGRSVLIPKSEFDAILNDLLRSARR